jgi:hypothetical protein
VGDPLAWGLCAVLTIPHRKKYQVTNRSHWPRNRTAPLVRPKQSKTDMMFGTWNVTSHYRSGTLTAAARELARYKLDYMRVQRVRWDKASTLRAGEYSFFYKTTNSSVGNKIHCTP